MSVLRIELIQPLDYFLRICLVVLLHKLRVVGLALIIEFTVVDGVDDPSETLIHCVERYGLPVTLVEVPQWFVELVRPRLVGPLKVVKLQINIDALCSLLLELLC